MRSLQGHFLFSLMASGFHYLFQVIAARVLGQSGFSHFSGQWAELSMFMAMGSWAHYWAALHSVDSKRVTYLISFCHIFCAVFLGTFVVTHNQLALMGSVLVASLGHSLLTGKFLGEGDFKTLGALNVISAFLKIPLILLLPADQRTPSTVFLVLYLSFLLTHVLYFIFLRPTSPVLSPANLQSNIHATSVLSLATHFFPVADVLWADLFREDRSLNVLAPLSLVSRAVFYFQLIFAQWWLPKAKEQNNLQANVSFWKIMMATIVGSLLMSITFRWIMLETLNWNDLPGHDLFYLACLNAAFMALHFQRLQLLVIQDKTKLAWSMLIITGTCWALLGLGPFDSGIYLLLSALVHFSVLQFSRMMERKS